MVPTKTGLELYRAGESVPYSGEYCVVDEQGNKQDVEFVALDEGERFPRLVDEKFYYTLNDTCLDEPCEVIGGETPDVE